MFGVRDLVLSLLLIVLGLGFAFSGVAAETLLFTGATVHTVSGETLSPGQVLVKDGKITGVGARLNASGAKTIDLKGQHLFPGLIAPGTTLGLSEINSVRATLDTTEVGSYTPDVQAWIAVNPDSELLPVTRANGITHFQVVPMGGVIAGQSALMSMTGWGTEEMTVRKPVGLHLYWPSMNLNLTPREELADRSKYKSPEDQAKERQRRLKELDEFFAEARAYAKAREAAGTAKFQKTPAWEAMLPLLRGEIPLMVHAEDARQIKAALHWTAERGFKMVLIGAKDAWQVAELIAAHKVPVVYDSVFNHPLRDTESYDTYFKAAAVLQKAGVKVMFSEGAGASGATFARNLPFDAAQAVAFGLPPAEALKGLTLYPAEMLGVADRLGSIEAGKDATLIACDGDILDVRTNVKRMWIAGKEIPLDSRHTRLYEKYKSRPKAQ
jgi:imidazolonepropionase-like amidohydrolase